MQFLFPGFLWALAALAIPIIIHLFYFRRFRRVYFTNVRFLRELKEETAARSKLRNLLVLAMRLLALAFLVLAFAQPFIPSDQEVKSGQKAVSIFVDNSFSMSAETADVPLLEKAKQRAREIVNAYGIEDRFQILTNDFAGSRQRLVGQEEALNTIDEIGIGPASRQLSTVLARQEQALGSETIENREAYLISDFQRVIAEDFALPADTSLGIVLIPLQSVRERNVAIDSVWFEAPVPQLNQNNLLLVRLRNYTDEDLDNVRLSLRYNEQTKPEGVITVPARSSVIDSVFINVTEPGLQRATLSITDFPVQFDDDYHVAFRVADKVRVLNINEGTPDRYLTAALRGLQVFAAEFVTAQNIDYGRLGEYNLIILSDLTRVSTGLANELKQYLSQGGNLLVFPPAGADLASYRNFLSSLPANELAAFAEQERQVGSINTQEFVFRDVFENRSANLRLPVTQANFTLTRYGGRNEEALLNYRDGSTALAKYTIGQGNLYLSAAPLAAELNNLSQNAEIFIPMLYKMAISAGTSRPVAYTIGRDAVLTTDRLVNSTDLVYKLSGPDAEFIPEQRVVGSQVFLSVGAEIPTAGFYNLVLEDRDDLDVFAFNYNRQESNLDYLDPDDLTARFGDRVGVIDTDNDAAITTRIEERSQGTVLWRWCLVFVLVFLGAETLLLRLWK
jgi:hypothetical protein